MAGGDKAEVWITREGRGSSWGDEIEEIPGNVNLESGIMPGARLLRSVLDPVEVSLRIISFIYK